MRNETLELTGLFALSEEIHARIVNHPNYEINFLTLSATAASRSEKWIASFAPVETSGASMA